MEKYFCLPFLFILCFTNAGQTLDGRLHLMTRNFGHPTLRTWAIENAALLEPYQKGLDLMGLENQAEGPLLAAADSLSNAHGWLTFDYRLYGITSTYTADDAQSLLPKIQADMQTQFNVGQNIPYALMVSWLDPNDQQAKMLLVLNWAGFRREAEYTPSEKSYIADLVSSKFDGNGPLVSYQLSQVVSTLKIELDPSAEGFWVVSLQNNTIRDTLSSRDTLFVCACDNEWIELEAFKADSTAFAGKLEWGGGSSLKLKRGNLTEFAVKNPTPLNKGQFLTVRSKEDTLQKASLLIFVLEIEFTNGGGRFEFDENNISAYKNRVDSIDRQVNDAVNQYDSINANKQRMRFKLIPFGETDLVGTIVNYSTDSLSLIANFGSARFSNPGMTQINIAALSNTGSNGTIRLKNFLCDKVPLKVVVSPPISQRTVNIRVFVVSEEDDDVQVNPVGSGRPNMVAIKAGPNDTLDTQPGPGDSLDIQHKVILTGADGICNTKATGDDIQIIPFGDGGDSTWQCVNYGNNQLKDSWIVGDDFYFLDPDMAKSTTARRNMVAGKNGRCETIADGVSQNFVFSPGFQASFLQNLNYVKILYGSFGYNLILDPNFIALNAYYDNNLNDTLDTTEPGLLNINIPQIYKENGEYINIFLVKNMYSREVVSGTQRNIGSVLASGYSNEKMIVVCGRCITNPNDVRQLIGSNSNYQLPDLGWLLAHEFGHALLKLYHPWDVFKGYTNTLTNSLSGGSKGQDPDNLMDYQNGRKVRFFQWLIFSK